MRPKVARTGFAGDPRSRASACARGAGAAAPRRSDRRRALNEISLGPTLSTTRFTPSIRMRRSSFAKKRFQAYPRQKNSHFICTMEYTFSVGIPAQTIRSFQTRR